MYFNTNEDLEALMRLASLKETDRVLSICGSGDQAFCFCPYAQTITAVDFSKKQIQYAQTRKQILGKGRLEAFFPTLHPSDIYTQRRNLFFDDKERQQNIQEKADTISFQEGNIFDMIDDSYTLIYLSNTFDKPWSTLFSIDLERIREAIHPECTLLVVAHPNIHTAVKTVFTEKQTHYDALLQKAYAVYTLPRRL